MSVMPSTMKFRVFDNAVLPLIMMLLKAEWLVTSRVALVSITPGTSLT